jgi:hypothetical protein
MTLQNRVSPEGDIVANPSRGDMLGNRGGCFHRDDQTLRPKHWASRQWICCVLSFKGRRRSVFAPGLYTELFFLDEATALAAGHRPCFECRRSDANRFADLWAAVRGETRAPSAPAMDVALHAERLNADRTKRVQQCQLASVPDGAFIRWQGKPYLMYEGALLEWCFHGYAPPISVATDVKVDLLTPPTIAAIISAGYQPRLHQSAKLA